MNQLRLGQCVGTVSSATFRRSHNESVIQSLGHRKDITFAWARTEPESQSQQDGNAGPAGGRGGGGLPPPYIAHQAGVNCLAIDGNEGRYLFSGGADSAIRLWDLEEHEPSSSPLSASRSSVLTKYTPKATLSKSTPDSHTHALTSISIYPFDPTPSTLLTTSYDKTLKITSITPSALNPVHTFSLDFLPYSHCLSSLPDSSPLIAVGTAHPAIRLLDLRSGLSTHSLAGPNGAVYSVCWSPKQSHILASGSTDGRVLFYDIRRANAVFASLDLDDAIGVIGASPTTGAGARRELLDFNNAALAHNGPVTSVQWSPTGDKIITTGHDQRIRVWDAASGRNDLVHYGPRIRNERQGQLRPLISPRGYHGVGQEMLWWPNDDGRGMVFQHHLREGNLVRILKTEGIRVSDAQRASAKKGSSNKGGPSGGSGSNVARLTSGGRINAMVWRLSAPVGEGIEMYTAHGDGRICSWMPPRTPEEADDNDESGAPAGSTWAAEPSNNNGETTTLVLGDEAEQRKKRKRDLVEDLISGLTKKPITFS
ncbi:uncharacterized protein Z520_05821 [Fonsecaea multimorphosa CBS 102226]|uniref:Uncharacterized protein n=1 Tax=Fonsecaea multimorphosa CBS 102226 TaxID=1442371 RepID=A0A0D2H9I3_9EURO|nr:uncharacterized protein Z520_05821 [Fonsecaea multimorphosa CBS 102226]KIX98520.1 hypothetical protein Z520_05821 [Fonsecaea multimorphosa CBS 102226]OAL24714.1 hypothetical protein AYO22_05503 [Fonsecaea multimorphosa]